jgi:hypothetical protein
MRIELYSRYNMQVIGSGNGFEIFKYSEIAIIWERRKSLWCGHVGWQVKEKREVTVSVHFDIPDLYKFSSEYLAGWPRDSDVILTVRFQKAPVFEDLGLLTFLPLEKFSLSDSLISLAP